MSCAGSITSSSFTIFVILDNPAASCLSGPAPIRSPSSVAVIVYLPSLYDTSAKLGPVSSNTKLTSFEFPAWLNTYILGTDVAYTSVDSVGAVFAHSCIISSPSSSEVIFHNPTALSDAVTFMLLSL